MIRGNRSKKVSTNTIVAFDSPNGELLGQVGVNFKINWKNILPIG